VLLVTAKIISIALAVAADEVAGSAAAPASGSLELHERYARDIPSQVVTVGALGDEQVVRAGRRAPATG
jgi:hypothetical protein